MNYRINSNKVSSIFILQIRNIIVSENEAPYAREGYTPLPKGTRRFPRSLSRLGNLMGSRRFGCRPFDTDVTVKDHLSLHEYPTGLSRGKYTIEVSSKARKKLHLHYKSGNKSVIRKIERIFLELSNTPSENEGNPDPLKYQLSGYWSRRINLTFSIPKTNWGPIAFAKLWAVLPHGFLQVPAGTNPEGFLLPTDNAVRSTGHLRLPDG